ncbi:O-antigen ligase family protein [Vibrio fluvialis]|uniref:O-antigen ligase family protein n=1 Tax=Vibrio fluvialis TaxID=676 RepID=UPI0005CAA3E6|nr:O-antigen ligase family protein [Vibrio fluvialis]
MKNTANSLTLLALFLVPAFLLSTNNWSVIIVALLSLYSIYFCLKQQMCIGLNRFDWLVIASLATYFFIYIPTAINDGTTLRYFQGGIRLVLCIPIYLMMIVVLDNAKLELAHSRLSMGVLIGSLGALSIAIYQYFILDMPRVDGFLYSINFGYLSCALLGLAATLFFASRYKLALVVAALCTLMATLLTFTRGAIFAIPLLLVLAALMNSKSLNWKVVSSSIIVLLFSSFMAYHFSTGFKERIDFTVNEFSNIEQGNYLAAESMGTRLILWKAAIEAYKQNPAIGLPYKQREELNKQLYAEGKVNEYARDLPRGHAHSQYFEMLASSGSLSFVGILMMLIVPFVIFARHFITTNSNWGFSGAIFVAGFAIFGLTEAPLQANLIGTFYGFMLATFFAMVRIEKYTPQKTINRA